MNALAELSIAGALAAGMIGGFVFLDDRHYHADVAMNQAEQLRQYLSDSERRQLRREIRRLEAIQDDRELKPREKDDLRELRDQLEELSK